MLGAEPKGGVKAGASGAILSGHGTAVQKAGKSMEVKILPHVKGSVQLRKGFGQVLVVPSLLATRGEVKTASYSVLKGDSPYIIAQKHQMDLSILLRLNWLNPRRAIFPGQLLLVKAKKSYAKRFRPPH
jgi:LysM repeat protein